MGMRGGGEYGNRRRRGVWKLEEESMGMSEGGEYGDERRRGVWE